VLSHLTALGVWRLPGGDLDGPTHVLVPAGRRPRATVGIVVHRRRGFDANGRGVVVRHGLPTCRVEQCVVDAWGWLPEDARRAAVIGAVGERLTTPQRMLTVIDGNVNLPGRYELVRLRVGRRSVYLDVYCREAKVNFELDGAKWHGSAAARERDLRRDAALAAMGIMVVRFTHGQLTRTPEVVRAQVRAIVAARLDGSARAPG
jgi:hypothetical protein